MAVDATDGHRRGKLEDSPLVSTIYRFSLGVENERADEKRDGRICIARPNSQARTGLTMRGIGNHTLLMIAC